MPAAKPLRTPSRNRHQTLSDQIAQIWDKKRYNYGWNGATDERGKGTHMRRTALIAVGIALMTSSAAVAQAAPNCIRPRPESCTAQTKSPTNSAFPFTLLDLGLLAAGASVALAIGATVRRLSVRGLSEVHPPELVPVRTEPVPVTLEAVPAQPLPTASLPVTAAGGR